MSLSRVVRRLLGRSPRPEAAPGELAPVGDDLPRGDLFAEPLSVAVTAAEPEPRGPDRYRARFRVEIRDAEGRRCPELAVGGEIVGPERTGRGQAHTDLLGRVRFQMEGPAGTYRLRLRHVAGGALQLERPAGEVGCRQVVGDPGSPEDPGRNS